jgi:ABC-type branched-subunit amino acid transport system ATPase component
VNTTSDGLSVEHLTVQFGGLLAVSDVSLDAPANTITGLIGPNGAGKTTTFNACTGVVASTGGTVRFEGRLLDGDSPAGRAARGLGRTFQRIELFDSMTVLENVCVGAEAAFSARHPWGQLFATRSETREIQHRGALALDRCGISDLARRVAGELSTGQRRLVELARVLASPFRFVLLDEPSSGLDVAETERFGSILEEVVADGDFGILLVEHDMALVSRVCMYTYVLDFGKLVCHGPTRQVLSSDVVKAAYLGVGEVA